MASLRCHCYDHYETWTSDSDDEVVDDVPPSGPSQPPFPTHETITSPSNKAFEEGASRPSLVCEFIMMGFKEDMVVKAIEENGEGNTEATLETLLTYKAIEKAPSDHENSPNDVFTK